MPDERTFASGSRRIALLDCGMQRWGGLVSNFTGHRNTIQSVAFDPKGETLATGGHDNTIRLWKLGTALRPQSSWRER